METKFIFSNTLKLNGEYQASIFFGDKASFEFATPPEFHGPEGFISPEELFVASAHACCLTTFIAKAKKLLTELGVDFHYVYVDLLEEDEKEKVLDEMKTHNSLCSFPTLVMDDKTCIIGYNEGRIRVVMGK